MFQLNTTKIISKKKSYLHLHLSKRGNCVYFLFKIRIILKICYIMMPLVKINFRVTYLVCIDFIKKEQVKHNPP